MSAQHDFSQGSVPRSILRLALPLTLAQLVNLLYSIVDRMYLGRIEEVGRLALTGVGVCLPVISILMAFANLCGVGGAPLCSIHRGKGEDGEAERVMGNAFTLLLFFGAVLTVVGLLFRRPILYLFGASDETFPYADGYLSVYLWGTLFVMVSLGMNPFINAQGFGAVGMLTVALGAVVNILLDPIFIFGRDVQFCASTNGLVNAMMDIILKFGLGLGTKGAALATVISQGCSAAWVLLFLTGKRSLLRLTLSSMALELRRVGRILSLGLSGFFMAVTNSLVQILCNATLQTYGGDLYVGVMTILNSVREVLSVPVQGMTQGCQPVLGYNYGAKRYGQVCAGIRFTGTLVGAVSITLWVLVMAFPEFFIRLFNDDAELLRVGPPAMRLYFAAFFGMSFMFAGQSTFVGLGKAKYSIFFSVLRKVGIVTPLILLLPGAAGMGVNGVFLSEPVSNLVGGAACFTTMLLTVYFPLKRQAAEGKTG